MTKIKPKPPPPAPKVTAPPPPPPPPATDTTAKPPDSFGANAVGGVTAGATAAPAKYDIQDDAALAKLQAGSPADQQLAKEITHARQNYTSLLDGGAKIYVSRSPGNGGAPMLTMVPKALQDNPKQPFAVDVHYSGKYGTAANPDPNSGAAGKIAKEMNGPPPTVMVLAEPKNFDQFKSHGSFSPDWHNAMDPRMAANDALKAVGLPETGMPDRPLTVSGHSAGGRAIANAITAGKLDCDKLSLQDCLYGDQMNGKSCAEAVKSWAGTPDGVKCTKIDYMFTREGGNGQADEFPDKLKLKGGQVVHRETFEKHYQADFLPVK
jgi:hypothetical protein